ncbi:MAG: metallophosphoesterase [Clostridia bacterium]|nr:metallophosphoesterase [Clostridia bacterium]
MKYVMADIHGEYELFVRMLEKISFSKNDELYICGDIIERDLIR